MSDNYPVLDRFVMLLVNNNRSKAYIQNLLREGHRPSSIIVLDNAHVALPEHSDEDPIMPIHTDERRIRSCPGIKATFDENEHILTTINNNNISHEVLNTIDVNTPDVVNAVRRCQADYIVYSGPGGTILRKDILTAGKYIIHVHPGWLPDYKGSTTIYYAMLKGDDIACSVIILAEKIDNGPVFYRRRFNTKPDADIDYAFDPLLRATTLLEFFNDNRGRAPRECAKIREGEGQVYYIIHPVLKHLAILKAKKDFYV